MKARRYLEQNLAYGPEELLEITTAFDQAWSAVCTKYPHEVDREAARLRLATIVLDLVKQGMQDDLKVRALDMMARPLN